MTNQNVYVKKVEDDIRIVVKTNNLRFTTYIHAPLSIHENKRLLYLYIIIL